tara:strand:+ start:3327 stop:3659 length:333 start_codon:yes stop_codon:yes gene_type:complete
MKTSNIIYLATFVAMMLVLSTHIAHKQNQWKLSSEMYNQEMQFLDDAQRSLNSLICKWKELDCNVDFDYMFKIEGKLWCLYELDQSKYFKDKADAVNTYNEELIGRMAKH